MVVVGQRNGTIPSTVRSTVISTKSHLLDYQYLQQTSNTCTKLNYTVFSLSQSVDIGLYPEGSPCSRFNRNTQGISVNLHHTCPPESARSCICEPRLAHYTNQCNITNGLGQKTRESNKQFWVGYDHSSLELILYPQCL